MSHGSVDDTIIVGQDPKARYCAYGDESATRDRLAYAYALFRREHIVRAEKTLRIIKQNFGFPEGVPIHCRVLFNSAQRKKKGLSHIDDRGARKLLDKVVYHLDKLPAACQFSYCRRPIKEVLLDETEESPVIRTDPKGIMGFLAQGCFGTNNGIRPTDCQIFISEEETRMRFIGDRRMRVDRWYSSGYSVAGAPKGKFFT